MNALAPMLMLQVPPRDGVGFPTEVFLVIVLVVAALALVLFLFKCYRRCPSNQILVIYQPVEEVVVLKLMLTPPQGGGRAVPDRSGSAQSDPTAAGMAPAGP